MSFQPSLARVSFLKTPFGRCPGRLALRESRLSRPPPERGSACIQQELDWAPSIRLEDGMEKTRRRIYDQMTGSAVARKAYVSGA